MTLAFASASLWWLWAGLVVLALWSWRIDRRAWATNDRVDEANAAALHAALSANSADSRAQVAEAGQRQIGGMLMRLDALEAAVFSDLPKEAEVRHV